MRASRVVLIALAGLAGCESAPVDEGRHIFGIVTSSTSASTPAERAGPGPFTLRGASGGLVAAQARPPAYEKTHIHNRLYVKTASGEVVVDTDDYFAPGACVEITPSAGERSSTFFSYRSARIAGSDRC